MTVSRTFQKKFKKFRLHKVNSKQIISGLANPASKTICEKTNGLVEKYTRIGMFIVKYVLLQCFIFSKALVSLFLYFINDLGSDAFALPIPIW